MSLRALVVVLLGIIIAIAIGVAHSASRKDRLTLRVFTYDPKQPTGKKQYLLVYKVTLAVPPTAEFSLTQINDAGDQIVENMTPYDCGDIWSRRAVAHLIRDCHVAEMSRALKSKEPVVTIEPLASAYVEILWSGNELTVEGPDGFAARRLPEKYGEMCLSFFAKLNDIVSRDKRLTSSRASAALQYLAQFERSGRWAAYP